MVIGVVDDNPRARRARVGFRRAISEHVPGIGGQTLNVGSDHLPCSSFLERSACRAANVSLEGEFVAEMNTVANKVGVKVVRVELAYTRKEVLNNPIVPAAVNFAMPSLRSGPPDSINNHGTKSGDVCGGGRFSTEKMLEVVRGW